MPHRLHLSRLLLFVVLLLVPQGVRAQDVAAIAVDPVEQQIEFRISDLQATGRLTIQGQPIVGTGMVQRFYESRGYLPGWTNPQNRQDLLNLARALTADGLDPEDAHYSLLARLLNDNDPNPVAQAERDILMTDAIARIGYMMAYGKTDPNRLDGSWNLGRVLPREDPVPVLTAALAAGQLPAVINQLRPDLIYYKVLVQQLARYRRLAEAGGWPQVPGGELLRPGDTDPRVPVIRRRLQIEGDLALDVAVPTDPQFYDDATAEGVKRFQQRHAIDVDGIVGPGTTRAMNVTAQQRVDQLRINLDRARWVHRQLEGDFVLVNIAGFYVAVVRDSEIVWQSPVIVGTDYHKTPTFSAPMTYIELNPTWTPTRNILFNELLPKIRRDPGFVTRNGYYLVDSSGRRVSNPASLPWSTYNRGNFPYRFIQGPGDGNALGQVKFMFPNRHAVYLHDTPSRQLFSKARRTFSHGCIRVKDPLTLAEVLLGGQGWSRERIDRVVASGDRTRVNLDRPLQTLLLYWTADPDVNGGVRFYEDIYERDASVLAALNQPFRPDTTPLE